MSPEEINVEESITIDLGLADKANQVIEYLENSDPKAFKALNNYFSSLIKSLKAFDFTKEENVTYDLVFEKTKQMLPLRNEVVGIITAIAKFEEQTKFYGEIHLFFENLLLYFAFRDEGDSSNRLAPGHYQAFGSELFLFTVAALLKHRRFEQLNELTNQGYYLPFTKHRRRNKLDSFVIFNENPESLLGYYRNLRVSEDQWKVTFLAERLTDNGFELEDLAQADFVLHFISLLDTKISKQFFYGYWGNQTLLDSYPFELFVRSESRWFFEKFAKCLREVTKDEILEFIDLYNEKLVEGGFGYRRLDWEHRIALEKIATRP